MEPSISYAWRKLNIANKPILIGLSKSLCAIGSKYAISNPT